MTKLEPIPCFAEVGKPGNFHSCGANATWAIATAGGSSICYCTKHKDMRATEMARNDHTHFRAAPFAEWRKLVQG